MKSLSRVLILAMIGVVIATSVLVGGLAISTSDAQTRLRAEEQMQRLLQRQAWRLDEKLRRVRELTEYLRQRIIEQTDLDRLRDDPDERQRAIDRLSTLFIDGLRATGAASAWVHYDPKLIGRPLHVSFYLRGGRIERTQPFDIRASGHDRDDWFASVVDGDAQEHWTSPYLWAEWGGEIMTFSRRLQIGDQVIGAAGSEVFLSDLFNAFGQVSFYRTGHLLLLDQSGQVLFHPARSIDPAGGLHSEEVEAVNAQLADLPGNEGVLKFSVAGQPRFAAYQRLDNGWVMLLAANASEVFEEHTAFATQIRWLIVLGAGLACILAWWASTRILRRIDGLTCKLEAANAELSERNREVLDKARELELLANRDPLTGLASRRAGLLFLDQMIDQARANRQPLTIAYVDVDDLKRVNDSLGHGEGDRLIQTIAEALRRGLREGDLAARIGGDEFLAILPDCSLIQAQQLFEQIRRDLHRLEVGMSFRLRFSVGFEEYPHLEERPSIEEFVSRADARMYAAKYSERNARVEDDSGSRLN